ncbi:YbaB/EbfC family nucleoid-associated protein [Synergistaceae bacterium OttesenSCG-928-D05]|nr:YbaB/EbfC family nucleoid-associated protein [Synergistaceae bacterium OttesenSCG-928-D05]
MNMDKLLKQAQKMQAQMAAVQEELEKTIVEGTAGGGMVKAKVNGHGEVLSVSISPEVVDKDEVEMLEDLVLSAIKDAAKQSKELANSKMNAVTGGMPGMPGFM